MRRPAPSVLFVATGALVLVLALGASRCASSAPDGLARVAADHGLESAESPIPESPLADYGGGADGSEGIDRGVAGLIGAAVVGGIAGGVVGGAAYTAAHIRRRSASRSGGRSEAAGATPGGGPVR